MWALSSCHEQGLPFVGCTLVEECILVALFIMVPRFLDALASEVVVHGLSSCGMLSPNLVALQLWDLNFPPGTEPTSPELEGGFLTTGPPRKSLVPIRNLDSTQSLVHLL